MTELNPYAAPNSPPSSAETDSGGEFTRGSKKGPAIYIVLAAIGVTFVFALSLPKLLTDFQPVGFAIPVIGCLIGAVIYRIRSRQWPVDPTAKARIVKYSLIACVTPPGVMFVITGGGRAQGAAMVLVCLTVGMSVAVGIILSGRRRHGQTGNAG